MSVTEESTIDVVRKATRELARNFGYAYWREKDKRGEYPWEFVNAFGQGGWLGALIPDEYGGLGLGIAECGVMMQEIAASGAGARITVREIEKLGRSAIDSNELYDDHQNCGIQAAAAKYLGAEAGFDACDRAMSTHGGYAKEYHVERLWREARLLRNAPLSQEMVLNYISTQALKLPRAY
jgi:alkylation response protein AidB-like acyl-CoA dehydrogenase